MDLISLLLTGGGWRTSLGGRVRHTGSPAALIRIPVIPAGQGRGRAERGALHPHTAPSLPQSGLPSISQGLCLLSMVAFQISPDSSRPLRATHRVSLCREAHPSLPRPSLRHVSFPEFSLSASPALGGLTCQGGIDGTRSVEVLHGDRRDPAERKGRADPSGF